MSQLELELQINASEGMISRIETGKVNPTKETVLKITEVLHLSNWELNYVIGPFANPVSDGEVQKAKNSVSDYFNKTSVLAYMVDERSRVWFASKGFIKFIKQDPEDVEKLYGKSIISLILDPKYRIRQFLEGDSFEDLLYNLFCRTYREMSFMQNDPYNQEAVEVIKLDKLACVQWEKVTHSLNHKSIHELEMRKVSFNFGPFRIPTIYSVEPMLNNERFRIVEYVPENKIVKMFKSFV